MSLYLSEVVGQFGLKLLNTKTHATNLDPFYFRS